MEKNDILNFMSTYDVKNPVNVTVIFEESDEEEVAAFGSNKQPICGSLETNSKVLTDAKHCQQNTVKNILQESLSHNGDDNATLGPKTLPVAVNSQKSLNIRQNPLGYVLQKSLNQNYGDKATTDLKIPSVAENPQQSLNVGDNKTQRPTIMMSSPNSINNAMFKQMIPETAYNISIEEAQVPFIKSNPTISKSFCELLPKAVVTDPNEQQQNITISPKSVINSSNGKINLNLDTRQNFNHDVSSFIDITGNEKSHNKVARHISECLAAISNNILSIFKAYSHFQSLAIISKEVVLINQLKSNYLSIKQHYFDLSVPAIISIVMTKKNVPQFHDVIFYTLRMARDNKIQCKNEDLRKIYREMIEWSKKKYKQNIREKLAYSGISPQLRSDSILRMKDVQKSYGSNKKIIPAASNNESQQQNIMGHKKPHLYSAIVPPSYVNPTLQETSWEIKRRLSNTSYHFPKSNNMEIIKRTDDAECLLQYSLEPKQYNGNEKIIPSNQNILNGVLTNVPYVSHIMNETNEPQSTRSSVSTDSGFASPLNFNNAPPKLTNELAFPVSDTGSLVIPGHTPGSPNVSPHIAPSGCSICGKNTTNQSWPKTSYCSHNCQLNRNTFTQFHWG